MILQSDATTSIRRDRALLATLLGLVVVFGIVLAVQSALWTDSALPIEKLLGLGAYWVVFALTWALLSVAAWRWGRSAGASVGAGSLEQKRLWHWNKSAGLIIGVALAIRLVVVFSCEPRLSDDVWRYIHDGQTLAQGTNPYMSPPQAASPTDGRQAGVLSRINHPELVSIYQPTSQYTFALLSMLHFGEWDAFGDRTFRLGFVLFDLSILLLVLRGLRLKGHSPWWAILYGWHPLPISEVAGSGHQDVVGIAALVAALVLGDELASGQDLKRRSAGVRDRTALGVGALLALAVAVKPVVVPLAIPLAWSVWPDVRRLMAAAAAAMVVWLVLYGPFLLLAGGIDGMIETGRLFVNKWAFNASVHLLTRQVLGTKQGADVLMAVLLMAVLAGCVLLRCHPWRAAMTYLLASVLLSSTAHPWYLLWALPLVPLMQPVHARDSNLSGPGRLRALDAVPLAVWLYSLTIGWSYAAYLRQEFQPDAWLLVAEYLPVYGVVVWGAWRFVRTRWQGGGRGADRDGRASSGVGETELIDLDA